jgi:hypothetical protein
MELRVRRGFKDLFGQTAGIVHFARRVSFYARLVPIRGFPFSILEARSIERLVSDP